MIPSEETLKKLNKSNIDKLLEALIQDKDIPYFSFDKENKVISFFIEDWCLELKSNGTWEIK